MIFTELIGQPRVRSHCAKRQQRDWKRNRRIQVFCLFTVLPTTPNCSRIQGTFWKLAISEKKTRFCLLDIRAVLGTHCWVWHSPIPIPHFTSHNRWEMPGQEREMQGALPAPQLQEQNAREGKCQQAKLARKDHMQMKIERDSFPHD